MDQNRPHKEVFQLEIDQPIEQKPKPKKKKRNDDRFAVKDLPFICLLVAITLVTFSFSSALKSNEEAINHKDQQISQLIQEVGEIKADLDRTYQNVETASQQLGNIQSLIADATENEKINFEALKENLLKTNRTLSASLTEKESALLQVLQKNQELKSELHAAPIIDGKQTMLILGHNNGLVDTIILAVMNQSTQKVALISIPRDLSFEGRKLSELGTNYGVKEVQRAVKAITGIETQQYVLFDFKSFVTIVDMLGGIEVNVDTPLSDNAYPGPNYSYQKIQFQTGEQEMDGERALQYVRSRKSTSDFDRSRRQQQVISSITEKAKTANLLGRLDLAVKIYASIQENIDTNVGFFEGMDYFQKYSTYEIAIDNVLSTQNYLYSTRNRNGQYILLPNAGNYQKIQSHVATLIN